MNKVLKIVIEIVLLAVIAFLAYITVDSIMKPVNFNKEKESREAVAIERLKDIRALQVAYKSVYGQFVSTADSLIDFYKNGEIEIIKQIGSLDDSVAVAHTSDVEKAWRKRNAGKKVSELYPYLNSLYEKGDKNLVFAIATKKAVKDTLLVDQKHKERNFNVDSLAFIPYSGGERVIMNAVIKEVSGVPVPLFEAKMPYKLLLKGMDNQLRINLDAERRDQSRYEGLAVGSIEQPNNNAGNWE